MTLLQHAAARARTLRPRESHWKDQATVLARALERAFRLTGREPSHEAIHHVLLFPERVETVLHQAANGPILDAAYSDWHQRSWQSLDPRSRRLTAQTLRLGALLANTASSR